MHIIRTPFRVSLFGGGTDFEFFYTKKPSTVISFSINKYCYITVRELLPYFNTKYRLSWSRIEETSCIADISHPSIRACLEFMNVSSGLEIHTVGDLPARSGLGSSSAFTAALLGALCVHQDKKFTPSSIAYDTIHLEKNVLQEHVGIQDQIQVAHGGFNVTTIFADSTYSLVSLNETSTIVQHINDSLILVYSGISRFSSEVHRESLASVDSNVLNSSLLTINSLAEEFATLLLSHTASFDDLVRLLSLSWEAKSSAFPQSQTTEQLLSIYRTALLAGASCGKLLGAGGGGFFAFFVPPQLHKSFIDNMSPLICVPSQIAHTGIEQIL